MYTPEEKAEIEARAADEIKRLGAVSNETKMAMMDMSVGIKGFTASLTKGFGQLGSSALGLTKQLAGGETGLSVFNDSIGGVTNMLGDLAGLIPYVGGALKTMIKGAGEYTQAVNKQADLLNKNYQEMSKLGATASDGVQGVYDNLKRMNYGTDELEKFVSIVRENSTTLAHFSGTVSQGLGEMAAVSQSLKTSGMSREFELMGISVDEMNKGIAGFSKMQALTGSRQKLSSEQQAEAAAKYIKETDLLAKMTGQSREKQQALEESAMAEERFAGYKSELADRAKLGDEAAAEQLKQVERSQKMLADASPETRKGFLNILSGTMDTPEAQKLLLTMPEAAAVAGKKMFSAGELQDAMLRDLKAGQKNAQQMAKMGINDSSYIKYTEQMKLTAQFEAGTLEEREALALKEQQVTDQNTKDIVDTNIANRKSRDSLQDLLNAGIGPVSTAMKGAASATEKVITGFEKLAQKMGVPIQPRDAAPAAAKPAAGGAGGGASAAAPAAAKPAAGGAGGGASAAAPAAAKPAAAKPAAGGGAGGAPAKPSPRPPEGSGASESGSEKVDLTKILKFTARSGSQQNFEGLNETFKNSVISAATEYNKLTGGVLTINSAKRDPADQQRIWDESVAAGRTGVTASGMPIGKPGRSLHERGEAVDIQNYNDPIAVTALNKYGLTQKVPKDPVHFQAADGGIVPPLPGGSTVLAGEAGQSEAVVPLPDGKTIPVQMVGNEEQMSMMSAQLDRLDQMVRIMQTQVGVSEQLLKYAQ
jgi:hypothetical protein